MIFNNTKKAVFYSILFFLFVLIVPHLCAQNNPMSPGEAAIARQKMVDYSKQFIGKPYVSGGIGPNSFDCSGLIFTVSRESIGYQLPRTTEAIFNICKDVSDSEREAGDLVFFKTTSSGKISHVGLYIGSNQFIHAASDGPNTGVIISSLREAYWKGHYYCTRRFLPASNSELLAEKKTNDSSSNSQTNGSYSSSSDNSGTNDSSGFENSYFTTKTIVRSNGDSFLKSLVLDASLGFDWSFFTPEYFRLNVRGFNTMIHARYAGQIFQPGIGSYIRFDSGTGNLQIPIVASLTVNEFIRIFAGPVIGIGQAYQPGDSDIEIENSFFPGILGICFNTPYLKAGKTLISLTQDFHYTVFNDTDGSALSPLKSFASGLVLSTGLRVTLPLRNVL